MYKMSALVELFHWFFALVIKMTIVCGLLGYLFYFNLCQSQIQRGSATITIVDLFNALLVPTLIVLLVYKVYPELSRHITPHQAQHSCSSAVPSPLKDPGSTGSGGTANRGSQLALNDDTATPEKYRLRGRFSFEKPAGPCRPVKRWFPNFIGILTGKEPGHWESGWMSVPDVLCSYEPGILLNATTSELEAFLTVEAGASWKSDGPFSSFPEYWEVDVAREQLSDWIRSFWRFAPKILECSKQPKFPDCRGAHPEPFQAGVPVKDAKIPSSRKGYITRFPRSPGSENVCAFLFARLGPDITMIYDYDKMAKPINPGEDTIRRVTGVVVFPPKSSVGPRMPATTFSFKTHVQQERHISPFG